ncbi:MAG: enolase C-terminal domain-like protein [Thermoanaerobaculia bacterium]
MTTNSESIPDRIETFLEQKLTLDRLELVEASVPQVETFRSAIGIRNERRALFVLWHDADGARGIGECSCRPDPFFNCEYLPAATDVIAQFVFPDLLARGRIRDLVRTLSRVRGWSFTTAAVLDAACDLLRRRGAADPVDLWPGPRLERVPVGISLGIFDDAAAAVERIGREIEHGYRRIKLKISPAVDPRVLKSIRESFADLHLAFDANGSFGAEHFETLALLAELRPEAIEQPFAPDRLDLCQELRRRIPDLRVCLDESLTGLGLVIASQRLDALDEVNLKPGRVGGLIESMRILEYCRQQNLPVWIGGMFETGVGRAKNLRVAACIPDAAAHDLSPSRRYFATDIVTEPIEMNRDGTVTVPADPIEIDEQTLARLTVDRRVLE